MTVHRLSRTDARRIAVRAQLLESRRPTGLLELVRQLTLLQVDPTAAIAPNADLVACSRLGSSYTPADLDAALEGRTLLELRAMIRPSEDLALYRAEMAEWPGRGELVAWRVALRDWVIANDGCRRDILDRLTSAGPLVSRDLPDMSPFDRLIHDRKRLLELFEFDYQLEMYKPAAKRRWGYFALPILYGDRLVGKLDATADREAGVLRVDAIHQDVTFSKTMTAAVRREIQDMARWLELDPRLPG